MERSSLLSLELLKEKGNFLSQLTYCLDLNLLSNSVCRQFAISCYKETLRWIRDPDPKSIFAYETAKKYLIGEATELEMSNASLQAEQALKINTHKPNSWLYSAETATWVGYACHKKAAKYSFVNSSWSSCADKVDLHREKAKEDLKRKHILIAILKKELE